MRKLMKILALIIIISVSQNVFSQKLYIGTQDVTNGVFFVNNGTEPEIEVVAELGLATNTQWLSNDTDGIIPVDHSMIFPFTGNIYDNKVKFKIKGPAGKLYVRFLLGSGNIRNDSITFVYTKFPKTILENRSVSACQNSVEIFHATETTNTEYVYNWQYRESENDDWIVAPNGIANNMPIEFSENLGYQYRCIVSLSSCETCSDTTGIITVSEIYPLPTFDITDDNASNIICGNDVVTYTITVTGGTPNYTVELVDASHDYESDSNQKIIDEDGGTANFNIRLQNPPIAGEQVVGFTTEYVVVDSNGCYGK